MTSDRDPPSPEEICPVCHGRGLYRPPGEWTNESCPRCEGRGVIVRQTADRPAQL